MFNRQQEKSKLDAEIDRALDALKTKNPGTEEYTGILNHVEKLHKMQETPDRVSYDTMVGSAVHLVGLLLIIRHENVNVITSKAMNFIHKPKDLQF
jgi:hypothetical protein